MNGAFDDDDDDALDLFDDTSQADAAADDAARTPRFALIAFENMML